MLFAIASSEKMGLGTLFTIKVQTGERCHKIFCRSFLYYYYARVLIKTNNFIGSKFQSSADEQVDWLLLSDDLTHADWPIISPNVQHG